MNHIRISYANSRANLSKALDRIRDLVGARSAEAAIAGSAR